MADDTVRVTTEPTEKDEQKNDSNGKSRRVQDLDHAITSSEANLGREEDKKEENAAIQELKADEDVLKKMRSQLKLKSVKSVGSSSVAADMLSKGIGFDQEMSKAKLSGQQFEAGVSSTKEDDQNDDIYGEMCANLLNVIPCLLDMYHTIARIKATSMSKEKAMAVNESLVLLKHDFGESKQGHKKDDIDDTDEVVAAIQQMKTDPDRVRSNWSQLKLEYGQSTSDKIWDDRSIAKRKLRRSQPGVGRSTKQDSQNDDKYNEIRAKLLNMRRCLEDGERTIEFLEAVVQQSEKEAKEVNAELQAMKAGHSDLKKTLRNMELEYGVSVGTKDRILAYGSAMKKKRSGLEFDLVGSSSAQDDHEDYNGWFEAHIAAVDRCLEEIEHAKAALKSEEETEGVNATFKPSDAAEDVVKDTVLKSGASVGSSSIADNASITSKSAEQDEGINSKPVSSTGEPSTPKKTMTLGDLLSEIVVSISENQLSKMREFFRNRSAAPMNQETTLADLLSEVGVFLCEPKEGASGAETVDEDIE